MKTRCVLASVLAVYSPLIGELHSHAPNYEKSLPSSEEIAKSILKILEKYQIPDDIDKKSIHKALETSPIPHIGHEALIAKIQGYVDAQVPIPFILIGFPFKSANHEKKVLGALPDMAERRSMEYLNSLAVEIEKIYKPGAVITIICDGMPFSEYVGNSPETVRAYEITLQRLVQDLPSIQLITSVDLQRDISLKSAEELNQYIDQYEPSNEQYKKRLETDVKLQDSFQTMLGRLAIEFDSSTGRSYLSSKGANALENVTFGLLAREMRLRSFIEDRFTPSQSIRLTAHYSRDVSKKFGMKLSPTSNITPYHGVLVDELDGRWSIRFRKDIDPEDYERASQIVNGVECSYMRKIIR
jgi:L-tyrosine isonitrile synthase